jgi:hypothetical protein
MVCLRWSPSVLFVPLPAQRHENAPAVTKTIVSIALSSEFAL